MAYGHAENLNRHRPPDDYTLAARAREVCDDPAVRRALAERDITEVYRRLVAAGLNQRQISHRAAPE